VGARLLHRKEGDEFNAQILVTTWQIKNFQRTVLVESGRNGIPFSKSLYFNNSSILFFNRLSPENYSPGRGNGMAVSVRPRASRVHQVGKTIFTYPEQASLRDATG